MAIAFKSPTPFFLQQKRFESQRGFRVLASRSPSHSRRFSSKVSFSPMASLATAQSTVGISETFTRLRQQNKVHLFISLSLVKCEICEFSGWVYGICRGVCGCLIVYWSGFVCLSIELGIFDFVKVIAFFLISEMHVYLMKGGDGWMLNLWSYKRWLFFEDDCCKQW